MVDPIGSRTGAATGPRAVSVVATQAAAAPKSVQPDSRTVTSESAELAATMGADAPVDTDRVSRIKKAIEDGRFPTVPSTIADRLLALKMQWNPNDPS